MSDDDDIKPEEQGFQFPGNFEITAVGPTDAALATLLPELIAGTGAEVVEDSVRTRASKEGRYTSVSIECVCATRQQYEQVHEALRAHDDIRYTL